jgi:hypothetical protein
MDISSLDITLIHKTKRYVIKIEVKTKPEEAENYIYKFLNDKVDRSAGVPEYKIGQVLEADYVIWLMTSKFGDVLNQYTASSSSVVGISRKEELKMSDFTVNVASSKYYYLDLTKIRLGMSSITELSRDIRMRYP